MNKTLLAAFVCFYISLSAQSTDFLFSGAPVFHGAKVVGNYPNTDFLFAIPATGERPISYDAEKLPVGLYLNKQTGFITGNIKDTGTYKINITVTNKSGSTTEELKVVIGDKLCLTPPMGWNSWNVFTSDVSEKLLIEMADAMAGNGMRDLGYQYINIDDFWHASAREDDGRPKVDPVKFPHGMKYLSDYMHSKGLKLGIYSCAGNKTCGKCFGGYSHEEIDAKTYAEWGIDLLKYDYCFAPWGRKPAEDRYTRMGTALKHSGRSIVFSVCEWGIRRPWLWAAKAGGSYWRTTPDIFDTWNHGSPWQMSVMSILRRQKGLEKYTGPGHWNDPDMLLVGNHGTGKATSAKGMFKGLTQEEYKTHFSMWCILNAPLLTSCDLRNVSKEDFAIITDPTLIAINQDAKGEQAKLVSKKNGLWEYAKTIDEWHTVKALFNTTNKSKPVSCHIDNKAKQVIPPHGVMVYIEEHFPGRW